MTLTKSHCMTFSYFVSTSGFLDVKDFARLSGYDPSMLHFDQAGLSPRAAAGMLGNCMSGNVLQLILPAVLYAGGIIDGTEFKCMDKRARDDIDK